VSSPPAPWISRLRGKFIAFEGGDGSGKSTQLRRLVATCSQAGEHVCEVREPGGTPVGEQIRQVLLSKDNAGMSLRCEMLLYMASRAQLVESRIRPALAAGHIVIADRFVSSTYAYQGAAGGLPDADIAAASGVACGPTLPDLVLIFDVDEATAAKRAGIATSPRAGKSDPGGSLFTDRMEEKGREFRRRVRESYLEQARRDPERHAVINARQGPEQVWDALVEVLRNRPR
jgi:dTMP kinase